jgi:hypothetical protein
MSTLGFALIDGSPSMKRLLADFDLDTIADAVSAHGSC